MQHILIYFIGILVISFVLSMTPPLPLTLESLCGDVDTVEEHVPVTSSSELLCGDVDVVDERSWSVIQFEAKAKITLDQFMHYAVIYREYIQEFAEISRTTGFQVKEHELHDSGFFGSQSDEEEDSQEVESNEEEEENSQESHSSNDELDSMPPVRSCLTPEDSQSRSYEDQLIADIDHALHMIGEVAGLPSK